MQKMVLYKINDSDVVSEYVYDSLVHGLYLSWRVANSRSLKKSCNEIYWLEDNTHDFNDKQSFYHGSVISTLSKTWQWAKKCVESFLRESNSNIVIVEELMFGSNCSDYDGSISLRSELLFDISRPLSGNEIYHCLSLANIDKMDVIENSGGAGPFVNVHMITMPNNFDIQPGTCQSVNVFDILAMNVKKILVSCFDGDGYILCSLFQTTDENR